MTKKFVFRSNKYNITHQDIQRGIEDRGYIDSNPNTSNQTSALDKWYKYGAGRDDSNIFPDQGNSGVVLTRAQIHDAIARLYEFLNTNPATLIIDKDPTYHIGYNFNKQKIYNYVEEFLLQNPKEAISFTKDPQQFLLNLPGLSIKNILIYQGGKNTTNTTFLGAKTNIGQIVGHHKDGSFERGLQGPFTEHNVGGYKHRHQKIGTTIDRPERFKISDNGSTVIFSSPLSGSQLNYNIPYARFSRSGLVKSVVNIRNIKVSGSNVLGNYVRNYEIINGLGRRDQNLSLIDKPQNFTRTFLECPVLSGTVDYTRPSRTLLDGTYNKTVFVNKFGAPGDINSISDVFVDATSGELSPYNIINYRSLGPRKTLKTNLSAASYFGGYLSGAYGVSASYHKTQRNDRKILISGSTVFRLRPDNAYVNYSIPATDSGYSWIRKYASNGVNSGLYVNGFDNDINFITNSADSLGFSRISSSFYTFNNNIATINSSDPLALRKFNIKFNGLWNFTSKQQLSNHDNKIIINNRKNNIFRDEIPKIGSDYNQSVYTRDSIVKDKYENVKNVYELNGEEKETLSYEFAQKYVSVMSNYYDAEQNKIDNFYKDQRNIKYTNKSESLFKRLLDYDKFIKTKNISGKKIKQIQYCEKIYPRGQNAYRNFARIRNIYLQGWANSLNDRLTELTNSQGQVYSANNFNKDSLNSLNYSYWPLDANTYYDSVVPATRDKSGELLQIDNPAFFATAIGSTYAIVVPSSSYFGARFGRNWNVNRPANVVHEQAGRGPHFNSYESFYSDIKLIGQGLSVVPEYRISPKLDVHYSINNSYYDDSFNTLELTGTIIEDVSLAISTSSAFVEQRATSDYIDLNEYLNKELQEYKLDSVKLKVKVIKKLLPYDEFYPQKRMMRLAQQFSSSYSSSVSLAGSQATFRTALAPMYAPGIGFNSIKAGVGMPYSIAYSSSADAYRYITSSIDNASYYYQKLPWETILYPYKNLQKISSNKIYDIDPNIKINSTASIQTSINYNVTYDYMANNFYSEVINFFKDSGRLTSLRSKDSSEWYFPDLTKKYSLDLVINKQGNFYTYSSFENFGPKPYAFHCPPWYYISNTTATSLAYNSDTSEAPNNFAIPGESYVRIVFDPASLLVGDLTYGIQGKFNIGDVIRNSSIEYHSSMLYDASGGTTSSAVIQLSDIVDVFGVSQDGKAWQPRIYWECPTADLNFYNLPAKLTNSSGNDSGGEIISSAIRGIWHQYASKSNSNDGLFLSVRDSNVNTATTGSLLDIVGFDKSERKKIGAIANSAEISEALIIVPFYQDECGVDKYFDIENELFERLYQENMGIVGELKNISRKYILPPAMDFIKFREASGKKLEKADYKVVKSPFLMFPFEFHSTLAQQDIINIWQGVMPDVSTAAEVEYKEKEFFIGNYLKDLNFKLPDNTRFKIFKIKKRAISNYQQIVDRTRGQNYIDLSYGYNWPYDYCSLVEMSEVKAELTYAHDIREDKIKAALDDLNYRMIQNSNPSMANLNNIDRGTMPQNFITDIPNIDNSRNIISTVDFGTPTYATTTSENLITNISRDTNSQNLNTSFDTSRTFTSMNNTVDTTRGTATEVNFGNLTTATTTTTTPTSTTIQNNPTVGGG